MYEKLLLQPEAIFGPIFTIKSAQGPKSKMEG